MIARLVAVLLLSTVFLSACGGGGDSRSPDRPALSIDPSTLQLEFIDGTVLPGTGTSKISARMLARTTDGVELGPFKVITEQVEWALAEGLGVPPEAEIATDNNGQIAFRETVRSGIVVDILSAERLSITAPAIASSLVGTFVKAGSEYSRSGNFTIVPPTPDGQPKLLGQTTILLDPLNPSDSQTNGYRLLQYFTNTTIAENLTHTVVICSSDSSLAAIAENQPVSQSDGEVDVTFSNPFSADGDNPPRSVTLFAIDGDSNNDCVGAVSDGVRELEVVLTPGTFTTAEICTVINPPAAPCDNAGFLLPELVESCRGLDSDSIQVPAEQRLQFAARLKYNRDNNPEQTSEVFVCNDNGAPSWSASSDIIFSSEPPIDPVQGFATTIDRFAYRDLIELTPSPSSTVTGDFGSADSLQDDLRLDLVAARVDDIKIERVDGANNDSNGPDTLYINSFIDGIAYRALCRFAELDGAQGAFEVCPEGSVTWASSVPATAQPVPAQGVETLLTAQPNAQEATLSLTATYIASDEPVTASRQVNAVDPGELVELRMFMASNTNQPDSLSVDPFACVGRLEVVDTLADGAAYLQGGQQFEVFALFEHAGVATAPQAWLDNPTSSESMLIPVTHEDEIRFSAIPGFWSGTWADTPACETAIPEGTGLDDITDQTGGIVVSPTNGAASFSADQKGLLGADGLLRLSTTCVDAYLDENIDGQRNAGETATVDGSTILVLPAADDALLGFSNELCETLEPVLTLGGGFPGAEGPGIVVPLVYGLGLVVDPLLGTLIANDDGGALPVEELISALITGDFSSFGEGAPDIGFGLGTLTSALLDGVGSVPGLGEVVDVLDACLLNPTLSVVDGLLTLLLNFSTEGFENINVDDCGAIFE